MEPISPGVPESYVSNQLGITSYLTFAEFTRLLMTRPQLPIGQRSLPSRLPEKPDEAKKSLRFEAASAARQHPFKEQQQYIYADAVCYGSKWLGVCDGVSGVQKMGIAPDVLPRELLMQCQKVMDSCARDEHGAWVLSMLKEAFAGTSALGATTVLLACIEVEHRLSFGW
eukprot:s1501_g7.t1